MRNLATNLMCFLRRGPGVLLLTALAGGFQVQAQELYGSWYWRAFASQGLVYTSDNHFAGETDDSISTELRELGLILGGEPIEGVHLVGQLLSRQMGEMDDGDIQLDYGFVSYMLHSDWEQSVGIKAGRIRSPVGFFNETRDVAHTRQSILLPQSMYFDRIRNLSFARDGAQLFGSYQFGVSSLNWDLVYGKTLVRDEDLPEVVGGLDLPGNVDTPFLPVARVIWDWDAGRARFGVTYHPLEYEYDAAAVDWFSNGTMEFKSWIFSAEYNSVHWSLLGEYFRAKSVLDSLAPSEMPDLSLDGTSTGYYLQGSYHLTPQWSGFLRYDVQHVRFDDSRLSEMDSTTKDVTLGIGWRPDQNWLVRAEWHFVDGTSWLSVRENRPEDLKRHWQMALVQISYRL